MNTERRRRWRHSFEFVIRMFHIATNPFWGQHNGNCVYLGLFEFPDYCYFPLFAKSDISRPFSFDDVQCHSLQCYGTLHVCNFICWIIIWKQKQLPFGVSHIKKSLESFVETVRLGGAQLSHKSAILLAIILVQRNTPLNREIENENRVVHFASE